MPFFAVLFIIVMIVVFWGWELVALIIFLTCAGIGYWLHIKDKPVEKDPNIIDLQDDTDHRDDGGSIIR